MKDIPAALAAHFATGTTTLAWCWRITRKDGAVFGFTDHDRALSFDAVEFEPESGFSASELRGDSSLGVDSQDAEGVLSSERIAEADIIDGLWDDAEIEVWRVNWQDVEQRLLMRLGSIGEIRRGRLAFTAEMRSLAHFLDQSVGRTFQYSCDCALGDGRCGVDLSASAFRGAGSVAGIIRDRAFIATGLDGYSDGWFSRGYLQWSSGGNNGRAAEVIRHELADGIVSLVLLEKPVHAIAEGDAFAIFAGCDKSIAMCNARFANSVNFRGFPHIPGQDTVLRYGKSSKVNDGSPL
jgi:uncharacterized phage protein (TIGR02218 family)